jgi:hypothetical protein
MALYLVFGFPRPSPRWFFSLSDSLSYRVVSQCQTSRSLVWCGGYKFNRRAVRRILLHPVVLWDQVIPEERGMCCHRIRDQMTWRSHLVLCSFLCDRICHRLWGSYRGSYFLCDFAKSSPEELSQRKLQTCVLKGGLGLRARGCVAELEVRQYQFVVPQPHHLLRKVW